MVSLAVRGFGLWISTADQRRRDQRLRRVHAPVADREKVVLGWNDSVEIDDVIVAAQMRLQRK